MKSKYFNVLDDEDLAGMETMTDTGLTPAQARVVVGLAMLGESDSLKLMELTMLRSSQVSISIKRLKELGFVEQTGVKTSGYGRPVKTFKLTGEPDVMLEYLVKKKAANEKTVYNKALQQSKRYESRGMA